MCGIVGIVDLKGRSSANELETIVAAMRDQLAHRGPDDAGLWSDPAGGAALGHRRLSIIDLSPDGRQPMTADGSDVMVTFNGEIYNFQAIRRQLETKGAHFRSRSDSEILPHLFRDLDPSALSTLSGMFAFGAWRASTRQLLLARDAFGKKPLYVYEDGAYFAFASEIQAFYAIPTFDDAIDDDAFADYLMLGYLPGPRTIYRRVRLMEPGSFERHAFNGAPKMEASGKFFRFSALTRPSVADIDKGALRERIRARLIEAVDQRMISDVPLGAFLSGGVDSSLVVAIVRKELGRNINTYSIGFEGAAESEHEDAREIAAHLGSNHHDAVLRPDALDLITRISEGLDQPNGDSSCLPTFLLSEFTRKHVTVALSGDGGDELFGGYGRYRDTLNELADPDLLRGAHGRDPAKTRLSDLYISMRWLVYPPNMARALLPGGQSDAIDQRLASWRAILDNDATPPLHRMRTIDANVYMPGAVLAKVDRMSMQHSLEVRCPLLDVQFAEIAMGLSGEDCWAPPATTKKILKEIAADYLPMDWMNRPKKGFGLPANAWGMRDMLGLCRAIVADRNSPLAGHLDMRALADLIEQQAQPGQFSIYQMWPLAILNLWFKAQPAKRAAANQDRAAA